MSQELDYDDSINFPDEIVEPEDSDEVLEPTDEGDGIQDEEDDKPEDSVDEGEPAPEEDEEEEIEEPKAKKKKSSVHDHIARINNEKYQAIDRARQLEAEVERLRAVSDYSINVGLKNYDDNVMHRLKDAKAKLAVAKESGDVQEDIDAQIELNLAVGEYQHMLKLKADREAQATQSQQQYQPPQNQQPYALQGQQTQQVDPVDAAYAAHPRETQTWEINNSWMNNKSRDYDDFLANEVHAYASQFEKNLKNNGLAHEIGSQEFFDTIDNHVSLLRDQRRNSKRGLNMKETRSPVSSNRSGRGSSGNPGRSSVLTQKQSDFAKYLEPVGVSRKDYEKYVAADKRARPQDYK